MPASMCILHNSFRYNLAITVVTSYLVVNSHAIRIIIDINLVQATPSRCADSFAVIMNPERRRQSSHSLIRTIRTYSHIHVSHPTAKGLIIDTS